MPQFHSTWLTGCRMVQLAPTKYLSIDSFNAVCRQQISLLKLMMYNHFLPLLSFFYLLFIQLLPLLRFEPSTFHFALWLSMFAFGCLLPLWISTLLQFCFNLSQTARNSARFQQFRLIGFSFRIRIYLSLFDFAI